MWQGHVLMENVCYEKPKARVKRVIFFLRRERNDSNFIALLARLKWQHDFRPSFARSSSQSSELTRSDLKLAMLFLEEQERGRKQKGKKTMLRTIMNFGKTYERLLLSATPCARQDL